MRDTNSNNTLTTTIAVSTLAVALLAPLGATGCDKKEDSEPAKATKVRANKPAPVDVSAIRSAVPKALAGRLDFEPAELPEENVSAIVPKGWTPSRVIPGRYRPTKDANLGFMTSYKVGSNCDGACEPKEWKSIANKVEFDRLLSKGGFKAVKDEALTNGRLVVARGSSTTVVAAAWWKKGANRYYFCRASLDKPADTAVAAFEQACRNTKITTW
jgi:hypothetical protein